MNWLFGSKRKSPEVIVAEEPPKGFCNEPTRTTQYESPLPPYPPIPRSSDAMPPAYPYTAPYPPAPYPRMPSYGQPDQSYSYNIPVPPNGGAAARPAVTNPLESVPFVLSPSLTAARTRSRNEFDCYRAQLISLKDKLATTYSYDFSLERSVIRDFQQS